MRVENQPYGRLPELIYEHAFTTHPYRHTTIGSMKDLEAASVEDVREFYRTYYVPDNATLALVGRLRHHPGDRAGPAPPRAGAASSHPIRRDVPAEPPQKQERRVTLRENWPLPVVVVAHHVTDDGHPDAYPLHIAAKILSDGQSSRIHRSLVYEEGCAVSAFGSANLIEDPNLFYAVAVVQPGRDVDEAERALIAELERLARKSRDGRRAAAGQEPVRARLHRRSRPRTRRRRRTWRTRSSSTATLATADGEFDLLMKTTAADVQRVARTYFTPADPAGPACAAPQEQSR